MATVSNNLTANPNSGIILLGRNNRSGLSDAQVSMLQEVVAAPAVPDEDCPELTDEQLAKFAEAEGSGGFC